MKKELSNEQIFQEEEYIFPYHYIAKFNDGYFSHHIIDDWAINYASTIEFLLDKIKAPDETNIVDIGCGDGRFSRELSIAFPYSQITGVDYSTKAIAFAKAMNLEVPNLEFKHIDISHHHSLGRFDIAVLMEVFEHIPINKAADFMGHVRSLLNLGGVIYLTVPHENKALEYKHFQHFSINKIVGYLEPHFQVVDALPFEKISRVRSMLSKILSNKMFILKNPMLLAAAYRWYKKNLFMCSSELECQRVFIKAVAK